MRKVLILVIGLAGLGVERGAEVKLGNEVLVQHKFRELQGKRIGLLTNPSGINSELESTIDVLRKAPGVRLEALFGAEHGVYGDIAAGEKIEDRKDPRTGLVVYSLYGATHKPSPRMLQGLDALVYDLQDTGCRSYTFISTMGEAMEACAENGVEFIVLDRPNPLGGERVEGPLVEDSFRSMVGRWNIPYVYGLTCGELARMLNGERWISKPCKLTVLPLKGWSRRMVWHDTGLPWSPTSPHVPFEQSPLFQVATGMLGELAGVSTGIGYTLPFECIAAPGLDGFELAEELNGYGLPGVKFRAVSYRPFYGPFKEQQVHGVQLYFTDPHRALLTAINLYALEALKQRAGLDLFAEAAAANKTFGMFDKVNGSDATRKALQKGVPATQVLRSWEKAERAFRARRQKYLLY